LQKHMIEHTDVRSCERHTGRFVQTIWKI